MPLMKFERTRCGGAVNSIEASTGRRDSNVTTLIAGIVLFAFGTGPIKGFAVTLVLGIFTSLFTAVVCSRVLIDVIWGRRRRIANLPV